MTVFISRAALEAIRAHVASVPDEEACGLLFGRSGIERVRATDNVAEPRATRFEVDPRALLAAYRAERDGCLPVVGHYHSHPSGCAVPSPRDLQASHDDGLFWLIMAGTDIRLWRRTHGASAFDELDWFCGEH